MSIKWFGSREWKQRLQEGRSWQSFEDQETGVTETIGVRKLLTPEIHIKETDEDDDTRTLDFTISSSTVDRDGDKIKQSGWELDNFRKNPVVLWAHDSRSLPIARATHVEVRGNKKLVASAEFVPAEISPFADMVFRMYREKFLNATSVGFIPLEVEEADRERVGFFIPLDINKQELLEFSAVPVPANPEALVQARKSGIDTTPLREWAEQTLDCWSRLEKGMPFGRKELEDAYKASASSTQFGGVYVPIHVGQPRFQSGDMGSEVSTTDGNTERTVTIYDGTKGAPSTKNRIRLKGPISWRRAHPDGTPAAPKEEEWSGSAVRQNLPDDHGKWLRVFTWFDSDANDDDGDGLPDAKSAWKLPHHKAKGQNAVVWKGVVAAMAALMGARGGTDIPSGERRSVYNHLARHYREDFDEVPPDFESVENQLLASEDYVMNMKTGRPEKVVTDGELEPDETDLALEQARTPEEPEGKQAGAAGPTADAGDDKDVDKGKGDDGGAADGGDDGGASGPYQYHYQIGDATLTCTVTSFEELQQLIEKFNQDRGVQPDTEHDDTATGKQAGSDADSGESDDEGELDLENLDVDSLIEKYGEDEILGMLPDIASEIVDSMLDQASGKVH